tara:strand:- start:2008 stop:2481 length:474 start_codon:yes stop_codon:yes gene_type:complete
MNKNTKNGLIVTTLILGVGYFLYKKLRSSTPSNAEIDSQIGGNTGVNPSLSEDKMKELANKMFAAFNGFGTDVNGNNGLINLFAAIKNNDDLMGVIAAYGIREISSGSWNPLSNFKGNLPETIADELSDSEITKINSVLVKSGVSIRFNPDGTLTTL